MEWNAWREQHPRVRPDLRDAALAQAKLRRYDLRNADLRGASLLAANLDGADLRRADLAGCDLRFCSWSGARLSQANLHEVNGADPRMIKAAERLEWRVRLRAFPAGRAALAAAALFCSWVAAERMFPERTPIPPPPVFELAAAIIEGEKIEWKVEGVAISGGLMRIRLDLQDLGQDAYIQSLSASCAALQGREIEPPVKRIEILRLDGQAGWLFEPAASCAGVLAAPPERLALTIAAASLPIRPKPSPSAALRGSR